MKGKARKLTAAQEKSGQIVDLEIAKGLLVERVEQLRMVCVTQRMLIDRITSTAAAHCIRHLGRNTELRAGLRDALAFFDRVAASKSEWTAADVLRLQQLRELTGE